MRLANGGIGPGAALAALLGLSCARTAAPESPADARGGAVPPARTDASRLANDGALSAPEELGLLERRPGRGDGGAGGPCDEIEAAWSKRRAAAGGRCTRPADCACYTTSLVAPWGQEATDVATARALAALARRFSRRSCPTVCTDGTPDRCRADCVDGRCVAVHPPP